MGLLTPGVGNDNLVDGLAIALEDGVIALPYSTLTQVDVDRLNQAIASPERQVTLGGQTITYRSINDLILARDTLQSFLNQRALAAKGVAPRRRLTYLTYGGRGFNDGPW